MSRSFLRASWVALDQCIRIGKPAVFLLRGLTDDLARFGRASGTLWTLGRRRRTAAAIFDLLVRVRPSTGRQIEQGPKRLHSSQVTHILPRISRRMDQLACPVQPGDPVRIAPEHCHNRHGLTIKAIAAVVSTKVIPGS